MKIKYLFKIYLYFFFPFSFLQAQKFVGRVGINTLEPKAALDVIKKGSQEHVIILDKPSFVDDSFIGNKLFLAGKKEEDGTYFIRHQNFKNLINLFYKGAPTLRKILLSNKNMIGKQEITTIYSTVMREANPQTGNVTLKLTHKEFNTDETLFTFLKGENAVMINQPGYYEVGGSVLVDSIRDGNTDLLLSIVKNEKIEKRAIYSRTKNGSNYLNSGVSFSGILQAQAKDKIKLWLFKANAEDAQRNRQLLTSEQVDNVDIKISPGSLYFFIRRIN